MIKNEKQDNFSRTFNSDGNTVYKLRCKKKPYTTYLL